MEASKRNAAAASKGLCLIVALVAQLSFAMPPWSGIVPPITTNRPPRPPGAWVEWDKSISDSVTGYCVFFGPTQGIYTNQITVPDTNRARIQPLVYGATYHITATARDLNGLESDYADEIVFTMPFPHTNVVITFGVKIEQSSDLESWAEGTNFGVYTFTNPPGRTFYRALMYYVRTNY